MCRLVVDVYISLLQAIVALHPNEAKTIHVYDSRDIYKLRTTAVPSHHCPGSVMLLFERLDDECEVVRRILYTGDFRLDNPLMSMTDSLRVGCVMPMLVMKCDPHQSLHCGRTPLRIDEMYLDTNYCSLQYKTFPSRYRRQIV